MAQTTGKRAARGRRRFTEEFKREAVQMLLDGHSAPSVAQRLGLSGPNLLYRWKQLVVDRAGPAARTLGSRVAQLEDELCRVERERDILKISLSHLRPPRIADVYASIEQLTFQGIFAVTAVCDARRQPRGLLRLAR